MLQLTETIAIAVAIAMNLATVAAATDLTIRSRIIAAAIAGAWIGIATWLGGTGALSDATTSRFPLIGVLFARTALCNGHDDPFVRNCSVHTHRPTNAVGDRIELDALIWRVLPA